MNFTFTDDQLAFAATVREILARHCPPEAVRAAGDGGERRPAWERLAEAGLFAALVPEEHGGLELGLVDTVLAFEETGRSALPGPVAETVAAAPALLAGDAGRLSGIATGKICVTTRLGDQVYAPDADLADLLILSADGEAHAVPAGGVRLTAHAGVDPVRRLFTASCTPSPVTRLPYDPGAVRLAARRATVATAAQLIGAARHLLDASVAYARTRTQFGTAIGAFQAVKHQLADVAIAVEFAAPLVYRAALSVDRAESGDRDETVDRAETDRAETVDRDVSAAKATAGEAAELAARTALQVHGAIGYTHELDLRLWLARVWSLSAAYGGTAVHRARLRAAILGSTDVRRFP
jgi:alkylation response protein AidB-like acyl-CoA dehydrogenase